MKSSFSDLLKEARDRVGMTQKELAERVEVDHTYISKIERGALPPPTRQKVLAIADALGIVEKTERAYFLLAAGCASIEDLDGKEKETKTTAGQEQSNSFLQTRRGFVLASPPLPEQKDTIGQRIDRIIATASLSDKEKEIIADRLVAVMKEMLTLVKATRQLK